MLSLSLRANALKRIDLALERLSDAKQIGRYLNYCSEMLSLTSKIAALYAERLNDAVVLQAVDEVETLTTGLSRKIWQKIMILDLPQPGSGAALPAV